MLEFTKMHGLGNDFIVIDNTSLKPLNYSKIAQNLCRRHFSVGADGIIIVLPSNIADLKMRIFNPDGSEAEMCGNGIRCFAKYVYEKGLVLQKNMQVETLAGIIKPSVVEDPEGKGRFFAKVDMGKPIFTKNKIPMAGENKPYVIDEKLTIENEEITFSAVSMGNPHCVIFVDKLEKEKVLRLGPKIEYHPLFPERVNVEFVKIVSPDHVEVMVWERGVGLTFACGTGACAVVSIGVKKGVLNRNVKVSLLGGDLFIEWQGKNIFMTGPAEEVFNGIIKKI